MELLGQETREKSPTYGRRRAGEQMLRNLRGNTHGSLRRQCGSRDVEVHGSTWVSTRVLASKCKTTLLARSASPRGSKGSLGRRERAKSAIQGQLRAPRTEVMQSYKIDVGSDLRLRGWMVQHCAWILNRFHTKEWRTNSLHT